MTVIVRPVHDDEVTAAYAVLGDVAAWLDRKGRRQRIAGTSFATYERWQSQGGNHLVEIDDVIAGIFSVVLEPLTDWPTLGIHRPVWWLRALATHPSFRGRGVGTRGVDAALRLTPDAEPLYLDCVSDFLPSYYARLGFRELSRQVRAYPGDGEYDITLMVHRRAAWSTPSGAASGT